MKTETIDAYARLLSEYCLQLKKGDKVFVQSSFLAEPLLRAFYKEAIRVGAVVEFHLSFDQMDEIFYEYADEDQLKFISPGFVHAMSHFDAYLHIRAPYSLHNEKMDAEKWRIRSEAQKPVLQHYFERIGNGTMRRCLCQYPTLANAEMAGMSLEEYGDFIATACKLHTDNPIKAWENVRDTQQKYVDYLDKVSEMRYVSDKMDVSFQVAGRKWINSDGRKNMPSGEVFSAPIEDSVQGTAYFDFPANYMGKKISGITVFVENGLVTSWLAEEGGDVLDDIFTIEGARRFGEVAIGTNYEINRPTGNILFDEKIGGTVHMALGQSYHQCGGKNESAIHLDLIANMKNGGKIYADGALIYENGQFLI